MFICVSCDKSNTDWMEVAIAEAECDCCGIKRFCRLKSRQHVKAGKLSGLVRRVRKARKEVTPC